MASLDYFKFLFALLFVLGLIAGLTWVARRFGLAPRVTAGAATGWGSAARSARPRRLDIVEILNIDARRRLILIRRDGVEHLVMTGERDLVIESGIPVNDAPGGRQGQ